MKMLSKFSLAVESSSEILLSGSTRFVDVPGFISKGSSSWPFLGKSWHGSRLVINHRNGFHPLSGLGFWGMLVSVDLSLLTETTEARTLMLDLLKSVAITAIISHSLTKTPDRASSS